MRVKELMTKSLVTCQPDDSLERAAQLMWECDVGALPVVDSDAQAVGMITDRDICMAAYTRGCSLAECSVKSAMSHELYRCKPDDSIGFVEETMRRYQIRRLPVVDAGRLVGIVSLNDLAIAAGNRKLTQQGLESVATTLARVCEHRGTRALAAE
jgi:CBS domain-containing protein